MKPLKNKLNITDPLELARAEERLSKTRALSLFEDGVLDIIKVGTFKGLSDIHRYLFEEVYDFAGKVRTVDIAKGNFRFVPLLYLDAALLAIDRMPQSTFDEIVEKYVEMNVAHPFCEGNASGWTLCSGRNLEWLWTGASSTRRTTSPQWNAVPSGTSKSRRS